jgi:hypothetical protein
MAGQKKQPDWPKRKLRVVSQNEIRSGVTNDKPWTLWGYKVEDEHGQPIDGNFKGWRDLGESFGKVLEFGVELQTHEKYGDSFFLHPPKRDLKQAVDELRVRVQRVEAQLAEVLERVAGGAAPAQAPSSGSQSAATPQPQPETPLGWREEEGPREGQTAEERFGGDDDLPF